MATKNCRNCGEKYSHEAQVGVGHCPVLLPASGSDQFQARNVRPIISQSSPPEPPSLARIKRRATRRRGRAHLPGGLERPTLVITYLRAAEN